MAKLGVRRWMLTVDLAGPFPADMDARLEAHVPGAKVRRHGYGLALSIELALPTILDAVVSVEQALQQATAAEKVDLSIETLVVLPL